jgi:chorismate mutase/prephenate dehydratase
MDLTEARVKIDEIDEQLVDLFCKRMELSRDVAAWKKEKGLPLTDPERERKKLAAVTDRAGEEFRGYTAALYSQLFDLSKAYQAQLNRGRSPLCALMEETMEKTPPVFPEFANVACQGVEGAYSQQACEKLFAVPNILFFKSFEGVFTAIEKGLCKYGVLPIENSTAGSVNAVYDLMMRHRFYIVRSVRLKVDHCLLAPAGVKLSDVREVVSHEQALNQCAGYLKRLGDVKQTVYENTAAAAKYAAQSGRRDVAALSSRSCAALYGLNILGESVQDQGGNFTRFICISREPEIYPGADRTSIMAVTPHKPGALYKLLSRFFSLGINLTKLESRPLPEREFEFMFYFDLEKPVRDPRMAGLLGELGELCERFEYLGSYSEIV